MSTSTHTGREGRHLAPRLLMSFVAALALLFGPLAALPATAATAVVTITGKVVAPQVGDVQVASANARLEVQEDPTSQRWSYVDNASTDPETDTYTFDEVELEPGTYRITSDGPQDDGGIYPYALKSSAPFLIGTDDVDVPTLTLAIGGTISGATTSDTTDLGVAGVRVIAYRFNGEYYEYERETTTAGTAGGYTVAGLRDGDYRLGFTYDGDGDSSDDTYISEFYDDVTDAPEGPNSDGITTFPLAGAASVTDKNASLAESATIKGHVTDESQDPVSHAVASLYQQKTEAGVTSWQQVTSRTIDDLGDYDFQVPAGAYRVGFSDEEYGSYVAEFFDDKPRVDSVGVTTFDVEGGDVETADAELATAGRITGTVVASDGRSFSGCLAAYPEVDGTYDLAAGPVATANAGYGDENSYDFGGLATGTYRIQFSDCGDGDLVTEYWDDTTDFAAATPVDVVAGQSTPHIDAALAEKPTTGSIVGTVTDEVSTGNLSGIEVRLEQLVDDGDGPYWTYADEATTSATGTFEFVAFDETEYRLRFTALDGLHVTEYSGDVTEEDDAESFSVGVGDTKVENAALAKGAVITGTFTRPLADLTCADAFNVNDPNLTKVYPGDVSYANATYRIGGLPPGSYKIRFDCGPQSGGARMAQAVGNWYFGKTSFAAADAVKGVAGVVTSGLKPVVTKAPVVKPVVKKASSIKISGKGAKKKATLTITVRASGVTPTGKVTIKLGSKKLKTVTLKGGKAKVTLKKQKPGKRAYTVVYSGDSKVKASTAKSKKITIKKK